MTPLFIRADASTQIGVGHVMRCLSLAQAWRADGGDVVFISALLPEALDHHLRNEGCTLVRIDCEPGSLADTQATLAVIRRYLADSGLTSDLCSLTSGVWVVADGYQYGADYQHAIKNAGFHMLFLDDYGHASHYYADIVLNQNLHAKVDLYANREPNTRLLLGTRYVLLREQFNAWRGWQREIPAVARKVLVTLGGTDPGNITGKVIEALRGFDIEAKVVVGGSNPNLAPLRSQASSHGSPCDLLTDVTDMAELMAWADVAIAGGGSTSWELAFMGLPSLVLVLADNQRRIADALAADAVALKTTPERVAADLAALSADGDARRSMSCRGRQMVDGMGASRVAMRLRSASIGLRRAQADDCQQLWEWANDSQVRTSAFDSAPIPWGRHVQWFEQKLKSKSSAIFVGLNGAGKPFGQVRFDWSETGEAEVDISVDGNQRNAGLGGLLIRRATDEVFAGTPVLVANALVKPDNTASIHAFLRAGYRMVGKAVVRGHDAVRLANGKEDE